MSEEQNTATVELDADLEEIFQKLDALPIGRAAKLVKALEERWGVSAAAPAAVVAAAPGAGAPAEAEEEKSSFDVVLAPNRESERVRSRVAAMVSGAASCSPSTRMYPGSPASGKVRFSISKPRMNRVWGSR